jgi:two-component system NtrC family sensor kinase
MMLKAAAPVIDEQDNLIGVLYGGTLLNRDFTIVDKIKETVYEDLTYGGTDVGTATIFQDDVRISTNVKHADGSRAIRTRVSEEVYNQVVVEGEPWIERAYVVNNWYITAYEPIRNIKDEIIGILYVGILEQKYADIRDQTVFAFLGITLMGAIVSMVLTSMVSRRISIPIITLVDASREVEQGNLDTRVEIKSSDELGELADTFNAMAAALKERDEQLKEFTTSRIMESERLALIGQLSANVAHELNNPLQGIVTYSHLLLEKLPSDESAAKSVQKIVTQANRCRDIIRGWLDFARQRKPDTTVCDFNSVMGESVSLVENQALFINIKIDTQFEEHLPLVVVDPSQMQQVIMNLIINAAEAMEGEGKLILGTKYEPEEGLVEIEITDTGPGIPEENLERIFDPFFTTKEVGHGTGLGLAISYGIIKEHSGSIAVESEAGKGTTFFVRIPVTPEGKGPNGGEQTQNINH